MVVHKTVRPVRYAAQMFGLLALVLPALFPSWRFFDRVEEAPVVEWRLLDRGARPLGPWQVYGETPPRVTPAQMLLRLFWNADRNAALFMLSCAERLDTAPDAGLEAEILARIRRTAQAEAPPDGFVQFRVRFMRWQAGQMISETRHLTAPRPL